MIEQVGNVWRYYQNWQWIAITTNSIVKANGKAVMGAGIAKQATLLVPHIAQSLGASLQKYGSTVREIHSRILAFPTKKEWWKDSCIELIQLSAHQLQDFLNYNKDIEKVYMPRPGCGSGNLSWADVQPVLQKILDDRVIILQPKGESKWQNATHKQSRSLNGI